MAQFCLAVIWLLNSATLNNAHVSQHLQSQLAWYLQQHSVCSFYNYITELIVSALLIDSPRSRNQRFIVVQGAGDPTHTHRCVGLCTSRMEMLSMSSHVIKGTSELPLSRAPVT